MVITRQTVAEQMLSYLNGDLDLAGLVDWAESTFIDDELAPDKDIAMLNDIISYLAAADTLQFPLTWGQCVQFLKELGYSVKIIAETSA
jgi:hypothetical protein